MELKSTSSGHRKAILQYYTKYFRSYRLTTVKDLTKYLNSIQGSHRYCVLTLRNYLKFLLENDGEVQEETIEP
ncbi:hypothetical protein IX51_11030 [uncultured archaeon]|nr:hypothetical protein IX51_11030 [uncultured archaeon]